MLQPMKYFEYIVDKIGKKCSLNGNHYIFNADLIRLTKMFSYHACIYIFYICTQKLLHIGHFYCIFIFHKQLAVVKHNFTCK